MSSLRVPLTCSAGEASPDASCVPNYAQRIIPSTTMHVSRQLAAVDQVSASCMCRRECRGMRVASFSSHHFIIFPGRAFCGTWGPSGLDPSGIGSWQWDAQKTGAWALSFFFLLFTSRFWQRHERGSYRRAASHHVGGEKSAPTRRIRGRFLDGWGNVEDGTNGVHGVAGQVTALPVPSPDLRKPIGTGVRRC